MTVTSWTDRQYLGEWDTLVLDGNVFPGIARVEVNLPIELDVQKGRGTRRARIKDEGEMPAKLTIKLRLGAIGKEQEEIDALSELMPLLRPKAVNGKRFARTIEHPNANFHGIHKIVIASIRSPMPDPVDGWELEIEALEWVPEGKRVKKAETEASARPEDEAAWGDHKGPNAPPAPHEGDAPMTNLFGDSKAQRTEH